MTTPDDLPEPLYFSPQAEALLHSLDPRGPRETILARQATWAAAHLLNLIADPPAQPDAAWLRLFTTADRIYHRNLRALDRLQAARPAPATTPALKSVQELSPAVVHSSPPDRATPYPSVPRQRYSPRPTPTRPTTHRADSPHLSGPCLETQAAKIAVDLVADPLPISATPGPVSPGSTSASPRSR